MSRTRNQLFIACGIFAAAIFVAPSASEAVGLMVLPTASLTVDSNTFPIPLAFDPNTGIFGVGTFDPVTQQFSGVQLSDSNFSASINGQLNRDPQINYGISVQDTGAPSTFGFVFSMPIVVPATPNIVNASIGGFLQDSGNDGVSITPTLGPHVQVANLSNPSTNMGVDVGLVSAFGPNVNPLHSYGSYLAGPQPGPIGAWLTRRAP